MDVNMMRNKKKLYIVTQYQVHNEVFIELGNRMAIHKKKNDKRKQNFFYIKYNNW